MRDGFGGRAVNLLWPYPSVRPVHRKPLQRRIEAPDSDVRAAFDGRQLLSVLENAIRLLTVFSSTPATRE